MNNQEKPTTASEITPEMVEAWKKQHATGVFRLLVEDKIGYVRNPTRDELKFALTRSQGGPMAVSEALLDDVWLGGDQEILDENSYWMAACMQITDLVQTRTAALEKC